MARSPASREALTVAVTAAAAWVVLVALLHGLYPSMSAGPGRAVRTIPSHRAPSAATWQGAPRVYAELDRRAHRLGPDERARVARAILEEADRAGLAPLLVLAVIHVESRYDPRAVSPVGAMGLMQLMEATLRSEVDGRVDPFDPVWNVRAGVRYLGRLVGTFSDVQLALVAYNAGPGAVRRHLDAGGVPARLLAYPRDVLREAVRLWPVADAPVPVPARPAPRVALVAAHRDVAVASAEPPACVLRAGRSPAPLPDACVPLDLGLPMGRERERTAGRRPAPT